MILFAMKILDQTQESLALLCLLVENSADVKAGRLRDSDEVFTDIHQMIAEKKRNKRAGAA